MTKIQEIKARIYVRLHKNLNQKITETHSAIQSITESRDADSKSSAGDKHETSRAMAQIELDKIQAQLAKLIATKNELERINLTRKFDKIESGSLVETNQGNYFIGIGIGKLEIENVAYFAISLDSPIGLALKGKSAGDKIMFQGREILIVSVS